MSAVPREIERPDAAARIRRVVDRFSRSIAIVPYSDQYRETALVVARQIHARSLYRNFVMDEAKVLAQLAMSGEGDARWRFFRLAVRRDQVIGGFYGVLQRAYWGDVLMARDAGWWVRDEARGGPAAILLLDSFETWARSMGALIAHVGQTGVENIERTGNLFLRCGYQFTGYNTAKAL
jgi:hypothetical protein